tara:strand:+ start:2548 stop:3087 length:540 start_codon:yes stop_codon:yes gene_type:complete
MRNHKSIFLLALLVICNCAQAQMSNHIISGLDLKEDWYTLTNQSALGYLTQENYRKENNQTGVSVDLDKDYLTNNVEAEFLNIGFTDFILHFPGGYRSGFDTLAPFFFIADLIYNSDYEYESLSENDFSRIASVLMLQFGPPSNTMKKEWGASFEWKFENAQLMLVSNKTNHIKLMYRK